MTGQGRLTERTAALVPPSLFDPLGKEVMAVRNSKTRPVSPLYDPRFEHDACGIGAVVDIKGRKSHQTVDDALKIVEKLEHRAGKDA